jgi:dTDP-4-dehydrorhamnose 3,5-epimerase
MEKIVLNITDCCLLSHDVFMDDRGKFQVNWDNDSLTGLLNFQPGNSAISYNRKIHTLRGLHYQQGIYAQSKLVTCMKGSVHDVVVDLRKQSPTYLSWESIELHETKHRSLFIPAGCAHGFLTTAPDTIISYLIQGTYAPDQNRIVRYNDPLFKISWPLTPVLTISDKDKLAPDFIL